MAFTLKTKHNFEVSEETERLECLSLDELLCWCWNYFGTKRQLVPVSKAPDS